MKRNIETKHWAYIDIGLTCLLFLVICDGCGLDISSHRIGNGRGGYSRKNKVMDWLLDLGKSFLNKEIVILISKLLLILPILLIISAIIASGYRFIGQIVQLCFDLGFAVMCLGLMVAIYKQNCKIPIIGYYVIVTFIKGVYLFFITSQPTQHGESYTLIFVLSLILHTIAGIQLLKTDFSVFGKAFLIYVGGIILSSVLNTSNHELFSALVSTLSLMILIYPFYKELPNYYNE